MSEASKATATATKARVETKIAEAATSKGPPLTLTGFVDSVFTPGRVEELMAALPKHVPIERFRRNFVTAIAHNPKLVEVDAGLLFREVAKAASFGLLLDPLLGEAYLVIAWSGKKQRNEPQLRIGYRGMIKLARQSGELKNIYAHEVRANDTFIAHQGTDKKIEHPISSFKDRGDVVGYYAVVILENGEIDFELMSQEDANAIRDRSDAWKAFIDKKIKSTPWSTDPVEMSKKTVLRRLLKRVPMSPDLAEAVRHEDAADGIIPDALPPAPPRSRPASAHDGLEAVTSKLAGQSKASSASNAANITDVEDVRDAGRGDGEAGDVVISTSTIDEPTDERENPAPVDEAATPLQIPVMPDEAIRMFVKDKNWLPAWKWICMNIAEATLPVGAAILTHHVDVLRAVAKRSDGNRATVVQWLTTFGITEAVLSEATTNGGK